MAVIKDFKELRKMVKSSEKRRVSVACAHDEHTLEAVLKASQEEILDYVLIGHREEIREKAKKLGFKIQDSDIISCETDEEAANISINLIKEGKADFIQKGLMQTATLLKAVVNKETGIGTGRLMSNVALLDIPGYHKVIGVTDGGMVMYPDLEQKKDLVANAVYMFHNFGYEKPKVGALCAVETVNPKMPETVDAAALKKASEEGRLPSCQLEGPISMDLAMSKEAAKIKGYESPVSGDVDILLVPAIHTGNAMVKGLILFGKTMMAGCVVGAKCPIALNSRSASFEEKYYSLLVCSLMVNK